MAVQKEFSTFAGTDKAPLLVPGLPKILLLSLVLSFVSIRRLFGTVMIMGDYDGDS